MRVWGIQYILAFPTPSPSTSSIPMDDLLRFLSVVIGAAGILGCILLIVGAQPSSSYGEVNLTLVAYGIAVGMSGLFWALLGGAVANMLRTVERLDKENAEQGSTQTKKATTPQTQSTSQPQPKYVNDTAGIVVPVMLIIAVAAIIVLIITSAS